ncbi:MAG: B12-binding domain-containing radical SAM protein [Phycisphaeraceae bacterium]|nr:B12-binding domain-containing radical SAM protein [Phycisphaeraceae bacterium]
MPHLAMIALSGVRVRESEMIALGMALPGLHSRGQAIAALPALGLLTLAGMTPDRWTISYHDAPVVHEQLVAAVLAERPALAAISALTASITEAYALADALRGEGIRVVIGGLHASMCPEEASAHADAVVVGDGESSWLEVLRDAESGSLRPVYRPTRPFDLAQSPIPRYDLLGPRERPRFTLQTARGCPLACEFCGASRLLGPFREKPAACIERELDAIRSRVRRPVLELADDNTFAGRRDAGELLGVLERSGVRYFTEADWRIGERPEILDRLAASGCVQVLVGVESIVSRFVGLGAKAAPLPRVMEAVQRIQDHGVAVIACFVVGGAGEDLDSIGALAEFLAAAPFADVQLTLATPFPGTPMRHALERRGRLLGDRGWESYTLFDATFQPERLSVEQLESAFRSLVQTTFGPEPTKRRLGIRQSVWARRSEAPV